MALLLRFNRKSYGGVYTHESGAARRKEILNQYSRLSAEKSSVGASASPG
jgi:hypothetical protein